MAYFSNGTEGMIYEAQYCDKCVHRDGQDGKSGCPVWVAHFLYAYEECNSASNAKTILDMLIPMESAGTTPDYDVAAKCSMFHPAKKPITEEEIMPAMRDWAKEQGILGG